jgi:hypothetical protein
MDLDEFKAQFPKEGACRSFFESVICLTGDYVHVVIVTDPIPDPVSGPGFMTDDFPKPSTGGLEGLQIDALFFYDSNSFMFFSINILRF